MTRTDTNTGTVITVPYSCTGDDITQISVLITDKACTDSGAQALYYGTLQDMPPIGVPASVAFPLPPELKDRICGTDYYVYITAVDVNGEKQSDYASELYSITVPVASLK